MNAIHATLFVISLTVTSGLSAHLTEQEALLSALKNRYDIKILHLETQSDSLQPEVIKTEWLPQVSLNTRLSAVPFDSTSTTHNDSVLSFLSGSSSSLENANSVSVSQHLPGGGTVGGSIRFDNSVNLENTDSTTQATALTLNFTQPLLREAWRHDPVAYNIALARLDNKRFSLEQQQRLLSYSSDIRNRFWKLYEAQALVSLYSQEQAYAKQQLDVEQSRVSLGISPPLDTLTARLSYINATARLHDARSEMLQLREQLVFYSGIGDSTFTIDSTLDLSIPELPPPDSMITQAERFDPKLRIFTIAAEKLALIEKQTRNSFLPNVALTGLWQRSIDENSSTRTNKFINNSVIGLIASYDLPIKPRKIALRQNALAAEINSLERENHKEELHLRLSELSRSWERERRSIAIARSAEDVAGQMLSATREAFSVGTADRLSLDKAENDYRSARIELLQKQLLMKQLEIVFDEITGTTLTKLGVLIQ